LIGEASFSIGPMPFLSSDHCSGVKVVKGYALKCIYALIMRGKSIYINLNYIVHTQQN